jgi:hypothetical protein
MVAKILFGLLSIYQGVNDESDNRFLIVLRTSVSNSKLFTVLA